MQVCAHYLHLAKYNFLEKETLDIHITLYHVCIEDREICDIFLDATKAQKNGVFCSQNLKL